MSFTAAMHSNSGAQELLCLLFSYFSDINDILRHLSSPLLIFEPLAQVSIKGGLKDGKVEPTP